MPVFDIYFRKLTEIKKRLNINDLQKIFKAGHT